jgi:hypothetical protein
VPQAHASGALPRAPALLQPRRQAGRIMLCWLALRSEGTGGGQVANGLAIDANK